MKRNNVSRTKTKPQTIKAKEKAALALNLRKEGKSFEVIAKEAKYNSKQAAYDAVKRALLEIIREPAEEVLKLDLERLDTMWEVSYLNAQTGDPQAISSCMKIMDRRAALLGLDAPKVSHVSTTVKKEIDPATVTDDVAESIHETLIKES